MTVCGWSPHHALLLSGGPGAMDRERGFDSGGQRPVLSAAEEPRGAHPQLHHPADLPLHLREQAHGHHRAGKGAWARYSWGTGSPGRDTGLTWETPRAHLGWPPCSQLSPRAQEGSQAWLGCQHSGQSSTRVKQTLGKVWNVSPWPTAGRAGKWAERLNWCRVIAVFNLEIPDPGSALNRHWVFPQTPCAAGDTCHKGTVYPGQCFRLIASVMKIIWRLWAIFSQPRIKILSAEEGGLKNLLIVFIASASFWWNAV